uniref:Uncharacterized protein n=1 Tax=Arundo donax TaxID=35708 RepID=A0A0A8YB74_ARUDO
MHLIRSSGSGFKYILSIFDSYGSKSSPIGDLSEVCHTVPVYTYVDGDGTVPIESARADGFAAKERVGVKADHRGLLSDENVFQLLKKWLGVSEGARRRSSKSKVMSLFARR